MRAAYFTFMSGKKVIRGAQKRKTVKENGSVNN